MALQMTNKVKLTSAILLLIFIGLLKMSNGSEAINSGIANKEKLMLSKLLSTLEKMSITSLNGYSKGLSDIEVHDLLGRLSYKLPQEAIVLYKWRNGSTGQIEHGLMPGYQMLSLKEAINRAETIKKISRQVMPWYLQWEITRIFMPIRSKQSIAADETWNAQWLPIFSVWDKDYLVVVGDKIDRESSPIYYIHSEGGGSYMAYDSIFSMMQTIIKCYENKAYIINDAYDLIEDQVAISKITTELNPKRTSTLLTNLNVTNIVSLAEKLKEKDGLTRGRALNAIILLKDEKLVEPLLDILRDPNADIRNIAVRGLGELRDAAAVKPLEKLAENDSDEVVKRNARKSLNMIRAYYDVINNVKQKKDSNRR